MLEFVFSSSNIAGLTSSAVSANIGNGFTCGIKGSRLENIYDPQAGSIALDAVEIKRLDLHVSRDAIGIVSQDTVNFAADAMENIRYGRADATAEEILNAARMAAAHEFIEKLPQG